MKKEIKIFVYIGSKNPNSTTGIISKELIKKIEEPGNLKTKVFYYSGADSYIERFIKDQRSST